MNCLQKGRKHDIIGNTRVVLIRINNVLQTIYHGNVANTCTKDKEELQMILKLKRITGNAIAVVSVVCGIHVGRLSI